MTERLTREFAMHTRDQWTDSFFGKDACVTPVLDPIEALTYDQNIGRHPGLRPDRVPVVPVLSEAIQTALPTDLSDKTKDVLDDLGLWSDTLERTVRDRPRSVVTGLKWPPL
jgi:alpha-methylacyl-CoA racemase